MANYRTLTDITGALSDSGRVRILMALRDRELCVCQLTELLGLAASTVSRHMSVLRHAGLVDYRKDGRWAYYRRVGRTAPPAVRAVLRWLDASLAGEKDLVQDQQRLEAICRVSVENLCRGEK